MTTQSLAWPNKDPKDLLDYSLNWKDIPDIDGATAVLEIDETISSVAHTVALAPSNDGDNPLILSGEASWDGDQQTLVWIDKGVIGTYYIECDITTSKGRKYNRRIKLRVKDL